MESISGLKADRTEIYNKRKKTMKIIKYVEISLTNFPSKSHWNFEKKEKINPKIHMGPQKT